MGHPARLQILQFVEGGEETVTSIQKHVGLTQAMTSQHLKMLFEAGLVRRRRQGTSIFYRVTDDLGSKMLICLRGCSDLWSPPSVERADF
jgi:ArsR family transcriptional regulator